MKKILLLLFSFVAVLSYAQAVQEGFYRIENYKTNRYLFVQDNRASIVVQAGKPDVGAIVPYLKSTKDPISDPQSVIYVRARGTGYDLVAQGMSTYDKTQMAINIEQYGTTDTYRCFATKSGVTLYLCDQETNTSKDKGKFGTDLPDGNMEYARWIPRPISGSGDSYFGIKPTIEVGGKYYTTFYAGFSFKVASSGLKAYIVSELGSGQAIVKDVTSQEIQPGTPVIFECTSKNPADNKIQLIGVNGSPMSNKLTGVYFCNYPTYDDEWNHKNIEVYNPSTMRILGKASNGKLAFLKDTSTLIKGQKNGEDVLCIPANTAILKAASDKLSDEMFVVTSASGIEDVEVEENQPQVVYSLLGVKVGEYSSDTNLSEVLPKGIYVVNKKKLIVK